MFNYRGECLSPQSGFFKIGSRAWELFILLVTEACGLLACSPCRSEQDSEGRYLGLVNGHEGRHKYCSFGDSIKVSAASIALTVVAAYIATNLQYLQRTWVDDQKHSSCFPDFLSLLALSGPQRIKISAWDMAANRSHQA